MWNLCESQKWTSLHTLLHITFHTGTWWVHSLRVLITQKCKLNIFYDSRRHIEVLKRPKTMSLSWIWCWIQQFIRTREAAEWQAALMIMIWRVSRFLMMAHMESVKSMANCGQMNIPYSTTMEGVCVCVEGRCRSINENEMLPRGARNKLPPNISSINRLARSDC